MDEFIDATSEALVKLAYAGIHITGIYALGSESVTLANTHHTKISDGFIVHYEFQWRTSSEAPRKKCMLVAILPHAKTEKDIAEEIYQRVRRIRPILEEKAQSKRRG